MDLFCPLGRLLRLGIWLLAIGFALGLALGLQTGADRSAPDLGTGATSPEIAATPLG
ncbi:hypothetical protein [Actinosynnema sp. NPDC023587]|uniref:hypothetical protein n=1 Tax=Actinosynnema sp. NPDC023587 TaxID=3154695 RepID=UPI0033F13668